MYQRRNVVRSEGRVASVDYRLQIVGGDLVGRYIQAEDLEGKFGVRQVFPTPLVATVSLWPKRNVEDAGRVRRKAFCEERGGTGTYPIGWNWDLLRQEQTAVCSESFKHNSLEGELGKLASCKAVGHVKDVHRSHRLW
jgi:hypothetical protein